MFAVGRFFTQELELQRPTDCPECGATVTTGTLPKHRRLLHGIYELGQQRLGWSELVARLIGQVVSEEPDFQAARMLAELLEERHGAQGVTYFFELLERSLSRQPSPVNSDLIYFIGAAVSPLPIAGQLVVFLLRDQAKFPELALTIFAQLRHPPNNEQCKLVAVYLGRKEHSFDVRQQAAVVLLRHAQAFPDICRRGLQSFAASAPDKFGGLELLRTLKEWVGQSPLLDDFCQEWESRLKLKCPRCKVTLPLKELGIHVHQQHQLVLVGRTVRRPWSVALDCLEEYAQEPRPELLQRGESMATLMDPTDGRQRFIRESLRRGIEPGHYRETLRQSAQSERTSICPQCFNRLERDPFPVTAFSVDKYDNIDTPWLALRNFQIAGLFHGVEIEARRIDADFVSSSAPTRFGIALFVNLAFLLPALMIRMLGGASTEAMWLFVLGIMATALVWVLDRRRPHCPIDTAWNVVVPDLLDRLPNEDSHKFIVGLAQNSCGRGDAKERAPILEQAIGAFEKIPRFQSDLLTLKRNDSITLAFGDSTPTVFECLHDAYCSHCQTPLHFRVGELAD